MNDIVNRAVKFMEEDYLEHKELFESLAKKQTPHTLFIGCADSRVVPNLITNTLPGELFVVRNIANIVPHYRTNEEFLATTSAIEYALNILNITHIIVCGHSNCGGCRAIFEEEKLKDTPTVKRWLNLIDDIKNSVLELGELSITKRSWITERLNIVNSVKNLYTFPKVLDKVSSGELKIYGWHYIIETGELYNYDDRDKKFKLLEKNIDYDKIFNEIFTDF